MLTQATLFGTTSWFFFYLWWTFSGSNCHWWTSVSTHSTPEMQELTPLRGTDNSLYKVAHMWDERTCDKSRPDEQYLFPHYGRNVPSALHLRSTFLLSVYSRSCKFRDLLRLLNNIDEWNGPGVIQYGIVRFAEKWKVNEQYKMGSSTQMKQMSPFRRARPEL